MSRTQPLRAFSADSSKGEGVIGLGCRSWRLTAFLFVLWLIYLILLTKYEFWAHVGVPHINPLFGDLSAILSAIECSNRGLNVLLDNPCDVMGRPHVYGSIWLKLSLLGLGQEHLFAVGLLTDLAFMVLAVWLIKPTSWFEFAVGVLILFSPATTLALERSNNDLLVFALLLLSAVCLTLRQRLSQMLGLVIIYVATSLKIYPAILFVAIFFVIKRNLKECIITFGMAVLLVALWLLGNAREILLLKETVPKPIGPFATGAKAVFEYLTWGYTPGMMILFIAIIMICALGFFLKLSAYEALHKKPSLQNTLFIFGLFILFFTYTINGNYDYRWIFAIYLIPQLFDIRNRAESKSMASRMVSVCFLMLIIIMWTEAFRTSRFLGLGNFNVYFHLGKTVMSNEFLQMYLKEFAAWVLFAILFAFFSKGVLAMGFSRKIMK